MVSGHGDQELKSSLRHTKTVKPKIQFTMEKKANGLPAFYLVILAITKRNLGLGRYTDYYLQNTSNHHPKQKRGVAKTLVVRTKRIGKPQYTAELQHLNAVPQASRKKNVKCILEDIAYKKQKKQYPMGRFFFGTSKVTDRISRISSKHNLKPFFKPTRKISESLRSAKDHRDPLASRGGLLLRWSVHWNYKEEHKCQVARE